MTTLKPKLPINGHLQNKFLTSKSCNWSSNFPTTQSPARAARSFRVTSALTTRETIKKTGFDQVEVVAEQKVDKEGAVDEKWREIHGQDDWAGMLDPMDPLLRSELIRYGEMAQACYDAFDKDPYSKYCGSCKFKPTTFFEDLGMKDSGYEITSYLYSSNTIKLLPKFFTKSLHLDGPWNPAVNWIGYVAVSNDETTARLGRRDITVAWRGTVTKLEWMGDMIDFLKPVSAQKIASRDPTIKVEAGFLHIYTDKDQTCRFSKFSAREQVLAEVKRLVKKYEDAGEEMSITITGHSLGSALAILSAYDIAETGLDVLDDMRVVPVSVFSFSGPRVGNVRFKKRVEALGLKVLRVFNVHDRVPNIPGMLFNEYTPRLFQPIGDMSPWYYSHIGEELALDHTKSPFLKETRDLAYLHNLEVLLHLIDGYHGKGTKFWLASGRDIALVNKEADLLKESFLVPPRWRQVENKGLRRNDAGKWELPELHSIQDHFRPEDVEDHLRQLGLA